MLSSAACGGPLACTTQGHSIQGAQRALPEKTNYDLLLLMHRQSSRASACELTATCGRQQGFLNSLSAGSTPLTWRCSADLVSHAALVNEPAQAKAESSTDPVVHFCAAGSKLKTIRTPPLGYKGCSRRVLFQARRFTQTTHYLISAGGMVRQFQQGVVVLRQHPFFGHSFHRVQLAHLTAKAVQGPALPLQGIHHIKGGDSLAPGVLGVGDCIPDDILQEYLHDKRLPGVSPSAML